MRRAKKRPDVGVPSLQLDTANAQVWQGERLLKLTPKAFAVLRYLKEHSGQLVTKDELMQAVWADTVVTDGALATSMRELRKALNDDAQAPQYIETVHRRGYRFIRTVVSAQSSVVRREDTEHGAGSTEQGAKGNRSALATTLQHSPLPLVGRDRELQRLHLLLEKTLVGERQLVFVTGEPGIGKTTLVEAFLRGSRNWELGSGASPLQSPAPKSQSPEPRPWVAVGQCIEHYGAGEAYLPILEALGRLCRGPDGEQFIALLTQHAPTWLVQMPALLSPTDYEALQQKTQGATRERMLRELAEALEVITAERPLILVLEDLHWSDPSTLDLLSMLARRTELARLLILGTYRPVDVIVREHPLQTVKHELQLHGQCQELALELLSAAAITDYLSVRFEVPSPLQGQFAIPSPFQGEGQGEGNISTSWQKLAHQIHQRTEGNPLFLVAMVEDLITRGVIIQTATGWEVQEGGTADAPIPDSIRQLVLLQSHRLSSETQQMLEAASIAGVEFSAAAVAAALATETLTIEQHCEQLATQQHFLRRVGVEEWPDGTLAARYSFLHAMYQQLWHERVSPTQLQHYHLRIGERKERAYGRRVRKIAVELAVHFERGREFHKAVQYLQMAGENAVRRSAHQEAVAHFTRGLELLMTLPDTRERTQQELGLQITLGTSLIAIKGWGALEVEYAYARARTLCREIGETSSLFPVLGGLCSYYQERVQFQTALELAEQLLHIAESEQNSYFLLWAHLALGATMFYLGNFPAAQGHLEQSLSLYRAQQGNSYGFVYDPGVVCLSVLSHILFVLGYPDQARKRSQEALSLSQELAHPFSSAMALSFAAEVYRKRREQQATWELEENLAAVAREHGFPHWLAENTFIEGWDLIEQRQKEEGIVRMREGLAALHKLGTEQGRPRLLAQLASAYEKVGQAKKGLEVLNEAMEVVHKTKECTAEAELYRLKGELLLNDERRMQNDERQTTKEERDAVPIHHSSFIIHRFKEAEECFFKAIDIARKQQAKSWELRATTSLARLWQQQDKRKKAHKMLSEIYNWFTEGFATKDLQEAKALIEELSH